MRAKLEPVNLKIAGGDSNPPLAPARSAGCLARHTGCAGWCQDCQRTQPGMLPAREPDGGKEVVRAVIAPGPPDGRLDEAAAQRRDGGE